MVFIFGGAVRVFMKVKKEKERGNVNRWIKQVGFRIRIGIEMPRIESQDAKMLITEGSRSEYVCIYILFLLLINANIF